MESFLGGGIDVCVVACVEEVWMLRGSTRPSLCAAAVLVGVGRSVVLYHLFPDCHGIAATVVVVCADSALTVACAGSSWLSRCGRRQCWVSWPSLGHDDFGDFAQL